jgi:hypothetical protein
MCEFKVGDLVSVPLDDLWTPTIVRNDVYDGEHILVYNGSSWNYCSTERTTCVIISKSKMVHESQRSEFFNVVQVLVPLQHMITAFVMFEVCPMKGVP